MPPFTQEHKCTDGSTDARIFAPSVHPTLYKSVGPTRHNGSAPPRTPNHNSRRLCLPAPSTSRAPPFAASGRLPRARASSAGPPPLHALAVGCRAIFTALHRTRRRHRTLVRVIPRHLNSG
jgi:hypothetical protein